MKSICRTLGWAMILGLGFTASAAAKEGFGTISGVVLDPAGTPQMGASVLLISEDAGRTVARFLSNQSGAFSTDRLKPGLYSVRVSVAGFLPAMERHVAVVSNLTTLLRVQVESVFSSLDTLRRKPNTAAEPDDWKWVLRSSTATRTILQWDDPGTQAAANAAGAEVPKGQRPRALVQVTNGTLRPGAAPNFPDAPATAVSYDQRLGGLGHVLLAGQMSYQKGTSESFASVWLPSGSRDTGPETTLVWREAKLGVNGLEFEAMRLDHTEHLALGDRLALQAGTELLRAGIVSSVTASVTGFRPHAQLTANIAPGWTGSMIVAADPPSSHWGQTGALESTIAELDSLPPVLFHNGAPFLEGGWHEEVSLQRKTGSRSSLEVAAFHDSARHQAIFGDDPAADPDFIRDPFSTALLYDGGNTNSWGSRAAFRRKISNDMEVAGIYAWAGALSPTGEWSAASTDLRESFVTRNHHSLAARVSGKIPHAGTQFLASYKWISGTALSRMDSFGEAAYLIDPNLHLSVRQPLPRSNGRWEALADFSNLLAEGYVTINRQDSRTVLVPVLRSFRGGLSFQF